MPFASLIASASYSSSDEAMSSRSHLFLSLGSLGSAPRRILAAMREHILYSHLGNVNSGVPDHKQSAAVVCALHSGVSRNKSQILAREMCKCFGATSVKIMREATCGPAQRAAVLRRCDSPKSGKRSNQSTLLGTAESIRSQVRKVVGSILIRGH